MPMGITRVADQYGYLAEASAHREALAGYDQEAADIAARHAGVGITPGMNDPRRRQRQATDMWGGAADLSGGGDMMTQGTGGNLMTQGTGGNMMSPGGGGGDAMSEPEPLQPTGARWLFAGEDDSTESGDEDDEDDDYFDDDDESKESGKEHDDGFGGKKAPPFGKKSSTDYFLSRRWLQGPGR